MGGCFAPTKKEKNQCNEFTKMKTIFYFLSFLIIGFQITLQVSYALDFEFEIPISDPSEMVEFSRNPHDQIASDSQGRIHLVYSILDSSVSPPVYHVMYRSIENSVSSPPIRVDQGTVGGGRHPSLTLDAQNTAHVVWHDMRNCTAAWNWIDNIEIYYNRKPANGEFPSDDVRLTETHADHKADNGYLPRIATTPDGKLHVVWYDFHRNGNNAEIYLKTSDPQGVFDRTPGIDSDRIVGIDPGEEFSSCWTPSLAPNGSGGVDVLWGFSKGYSVYYQIQTRFVSADGSLGPIETIADQSGTFYDPPRLAYDSQGNLGLAYVVSRNSGSGIAFQYRPKGQDWNSPFIVDSGENDSLQPDVAFDSQGKAYIVWQENAGGIYEIHLAVVDPHSRTVELRKRISSDDADARTPAIAIDPTDRAHIAWCDYRDENAPRIFYVRETRTGVKRWSLF